MHADCTIGGSYVVLFLGHDEYIDARKDVRTPEHSRIEYVVNGHVRRSAVIGNERAPVYIMAIARAHVRFGTLDKSTNS